MIRSNSFFRSSTLPSLLRPATQAEAPFKFRFTTAELRSWSPVEPHGLGRLRGEYTLRSQGEGVRRERCRDKEKKDSTLTPHWLSKEQRRSVAEAGAGALGWIGEEYEMLTPLLRLQTRLPLPLAPPLPCPLPPVVCGARQLSLRTPHRHRQGHDQ
jgi:hypothetical protein